MFMPEQRARIYWFVFKHMRFTNRQSKKFRRRRSSDRVDAGIFIRVDNRCTVLMPLSFCGAKGDTVVFCSAKGRLPKISCF